MIRPDWKLQVNNYRTGVELPASMVWPAGRHDRSIDDTCLAFVKAVMLCARTFKFNADFGFGIGCA
jgi:hypothetical protein